MRLLLLLMVLVLLLLVLLLTPLMPMLLQLLVVFGSSAVAAAADAGWQVLQLLLGVCELQFLLLGMCVLLKCMRLRLLWEQVRDCVQRSGNECVQWPLVGWRYLWTRARLA